MGLAVVLLFWIAFGLIASVVAVLTFDGIANLLTRGAQRHGRMVVVAAAAFPFVCLVWAGGVFAFQAVVNEGLLQRDLGLGDTWHCPLTNGYQLLMIDVTDSGEIYNPKTQPS